MAGWNTDIPWEDGFPDDLPPEERWEFSIAQMADEGSDAADEVPTDIRREPIARQMLDRYRRLDALLRSEAARPIDGFDWDATADQIDQFVRIQADTEERSLLLGGADTTSRSFWANGWIKPLAGLAAAATVAFAIYGLWPVTTSPTPQPSVAENPRDPLAPTVDAVEPVLIVEVPRTPQPGGSETIDGAGTLEVELVQPPDLAGMLWDLPSITSHERSTPSEVFIGPAEAPLEEPAVEQ